MPTEQVGDRYAAAAPWPGPGDQITRALRGPYRAVCYEVINKVGWVRKLHTCRHRHLDTAGAFKCGKARLEVIRKAELAT